MRKQGFTLVELLAVLVVLAVILAIAVPSVSNIIKSSTMKAFESDAKMVLNAIRLKEIEIDNLNPEEIDETNIDTILGLSNANYDDLEITIYNNEKYIAVRGRGKWAGFSACGTFRNIRVNEGACANDFEDPVITLLGDDPVTINVGDTYVDAGATASDDTDEDIASKIVVTGEVNVNQVGTYILSYDVTDNSGRNAITVTRTVHVIDTNNPIITFGTDGNSTWAQTRSTTVTVSDVGGVDASSLKYLWNTSTTEPSEGTFSTTFTSGGTISSPAGVTGGYYLWIIAKDTQGNTTITRTNVFNLDNTAPVITMNGSSLINVSIGSSYTDAGATASDEHSGVGSVIPTGTVTVGTVGTYYIHYNVTDNAGNTAVEVVRTVKVYAPSFLAIENAGGTYGYMYKYTYNGSSWSSTQVTSSKYFVTMSTIDTNSFYAVDSAGGTYGYLFKYTYNGSSWSGTQIGSPKAFVDVAAINANSFFAIDSSGGTYGYIYKYTYSGGNWSGTQIISPKAFVTMSIIDANSFYAVDSAGGTYGYIYKYTYNGSSWSGTQLVSPKAFVSVVAIDANSFYAIDSSGGTYGYIYKYTYSGGSWNGTQIISPTAFVSMSLIDPNSFYAENSISGQPYGYIYKYTYNGSSWNEKSIITNKTFIDIKNINVSN